MRFWWTKLCAIDRPPPSGPSRALSGTHTPVKRSEEHTSELQSLMRISYAVFCLKKKKTTYKHQTPKSNSNNIIREEYTNQAQHTKQTDHPPPKPRTKN